MSINDKDPGPSHDGRMDPINNVENDDTVGRNYEDNDGSSNASENEDPVRFMEGYTPLDFNMNELVSMRDDGSDSNDDVYHIDEDMNDGEPVIYGYYHTIDTTPRRLNGVKDGALLGYHIHVDGASIHADASDGSDDDNPANENAGSDPTDESEDVPVDFHLLADRALRGLEVEHSSTLERSTIADMNFAVTSDDRSTENVNVEDPLPTESIDDPSYGENMRIHDRTGADSYDSSTYLAIPAASTTPVDIGAIQKALQSIRLKSPQLATNLDAGASSSSLASAAHAATDAALDSVVDATSRAIEHSRRQQYTSHGIIPAGPLAAFRRSTPKAQAASANLTRSATLSEAVLRLWPLICFRKKVVAIGLLPQKQANRYSKTLTIHILGADGVECSSAESVRKSVGSFVRWMDAALHSGALGELKVNGVATRRQLIEIDSLLIEFSGPNIPGALVGDVLDLLSHSNSSPLRLASAKATFQQRQYHEIRSYTCENDAPMIDIAVAFNAGIWGYDSWKPTIALMSSPDKKTSSGIVGKTLFVITAYTKEECNDDADVVVNVIEEILSKTNHAGGSIARQLWIETNPFSSRCERFTASAPPGRKYFENGAWQAWLLG
ncbi:hypothetical protein ACHAXA_007326 [Cyclostephanos tholiformis]|uniref:Mitochondrial splicing suppressor 51-like C-terminal domain-containing protein n=1 Tax=Cyclostephanos tholiformis TaxID=382380 RepID=A0ABD3R4A3_9STRA